MKKTHSIHFCLVYDDSLCSLLTNFDFNLPNLLGYLSLILISFMILIFAVLLDGPSSATRSPKRHETRTSQITIRRIEGLEEEGAP